MAFLKRRKDMEKKEPEIEEVEPQPMQSMPPLQRGPMYQQQSQAPVVSRPRLRSPQRQSEVISPEEAAVSIVNSAAESEDWELWINNFSFFLNRYMERSK